MIKYDEKTMPTLTVPNATSSRRKRWTRDEYYRLGEQGLLGTHRWELIRGEIVEIMPQKPPHATGVHRVMIALTEIFGLEHLLVQMPIVLGPEDEPEPDVAITTGTTRDYSQQHPGSDDIRLVVEVSASTLQDDLTIKASLYASAAINEYWVLDVENRRLHVHRRPSNSNWGEIQNLAETESIAPMAAPESSILIAQLFGNSEP
jgi:Uma2 family endonuclease